MASLQLVIAAQALADPMYTAIDLGTGNPTFGTNSSGGGTVTGSNGLSYSFNPVANYLPAQWDNVTQGVPIVAPPPFNAPGTYGDPSNAYSYSYLSFMNSQGLAAGINQYGVNGHLADSEAFVTQRQPDGSWGTPIAIWSGNETFAGEGSSQMGILGISPNGLVLGIGAFSQYGSSFPILNLYDATTHALTNLTNMVNSLPWTTSTELHPVPFPNWNLLSVLGRLDNDGRILVQAAQGLQGSAHELLLVPAGVSDGPLIVPEPATWLVFASMIGGWLGYQRVRVRTRV